MKRLLYAAAVLVIAAGAFWAGSFHGHRNLSPTETLGGRVVLYYMDPMNPTHTSDKPGLAPCGMKLEPVYADTLSAADSSKALVSSVPGAVRVGPEKQQIIGVRVAGAPRVALPLFRRCRWLRCSRPSASLHCPMDRLPRGVFPPRWVQ